MLGYFPYILNPACLVMYHTRWNVVINYLTYHHFPLVPLVPLTPELHVWWCNYPSHRLVTFSNPPRRVLRYSSLIDQFLSLPPPCDLLQHPAARPQVQLAGRPVLIPPTAL